MSTRISKQSYVADNQLTEIWKLNYDAQDMLPELRKQIYVNYFMKNEICKLNYVNQNKNRRTFQNTQNTEEKNLCLGADAGQTL